VVGRGFGAPGRPICFTSYF